MSDHSTKPTSGSKCQVHQVLSCISDGIASAIGSIHRVLTRGHSSSDNGRSFSLIVFIAVFAITMTLIITDNINTSNAQPIGPMIAVMVLMTLAIAAMVVLLCTVRAKAEIVVDNEAGKSWKIHIRQQLVLFGMVPFYFISISLLIHRVIDDTACWTVWSYDSLINNSTQTTDRQVISNLINVHHTRPLFNSVLGVFMGLEMILCCQFHNHRFKQNHLIMLALAFIEATNLSVWLDMVLSESYIGVAKRHQETRKVEHILDSGRFIWTNISSAEYNETVDCLLENRLEHHLFETSSKLLYPFAVEFLFLANECVAFWFFNCDTTQARLSEELSALVEMSDAKKKDELCSDPVSSTFENISRSSGSSLHVAKYPVLSSVNVVPPEQSDNTEHSLAAVDGDPGRIDSKDPRNDINVEPCRRRFAFPCHFVWTTMVGIINVLFINSGIVSYYFNDAYKTTVLVYRVTYLSFICLCTLICIAAVTFASGTQRKSKAISGFEYLVVITMLGPICQVVFSIIADGSSVAIIEVLNAVEIILQTLLYFKSSRLRPKSDKKNWLLRGVLFLLLISNGVIWLEASLIETMNLESSFQKQYYNAIWLYIYAITNPVNLVYRFNSCILFINVYLENS